MNSKTCPKVPYLGYPGHRPLALIGSYLEQISQSEFSQTKSMKRLSASPPWFLAYKYKLQPKSWHAHNCSGSVVGAVLGVDALALVGVPVLAHRAAGPVGVRANPDPASIAAAIPVASAPPVPAPHRASELWRLGHDLGPSTGKLSSWAR